MTAATTFVFKTADESRFDQTAGFIDDAELLLALEEGAYWIEANIVGRASSLYASQIRGRLQFSGALYDPGMHVVGTSNDSYYTSAYQAGSTRQSVYLSQTGLDTYMIMDNTTSNSSAFRAGMCFSGRITCLSSGVLSFNWAHYDNGFAGSTNPSVVFAGSWLYVTPLDICPI
jgi:hypothetical protein